MMAIILHFGATLENVRTADDLLDACRRPPPARHPLWLGCRRRDVSHHAGHRGRARRPRHPDGAAGEGVRLGHRRNLFRDGAAVRAVRANGAIRGRVPQPVGREVLGATVATRWFAQRRGLVMGLLSATNATGQLIFQPIFAHVTVSFGWRSTVSLICAMLAVAGVAVLLLMRDRPSDVGLPLYGEKDVTPAPAQQSGLVLLLASPLMILRDAARVPVFWVLFGSFFVCGASTAGLIQTHFVTLCGDYGIMPVGAASVLAMMGAFDLLGTVGSGWLSDRYDNRWLLFWYYGLRGLSLIYLPFTGFTFYGLALFAVFYGLDWLATVPPTLKLTIERFRPERANVVFGWMFTGHQLGSAAVAYGAGRSRPAYASYLPPFFFSVALCLFAPLLVLPTAKPNTHALP